MKNEKEQKIHTHSGGLKFIFGEVGVCKSKAWQNFLNVGKGFYINRCVFLG